MSSLAPLPQRAGAYRWYYADVGCGDVSAVVIFLLGSLFSPRYAARRRALPIEHCAVNFALYVGGRRRQWVLTEYPTGTQSGGVLSIGRSSFRVRSDETVEIEVRERLAPLGGETRAELVLRPTAPGLDVVPLLPDGSHTWEPRAPRCDAELRLPILGQVLRGHGYHDANAGDSPLGSTLPSWSWTRVHAPDQTAIDFRLPAGERITLHTGARGSSVSRARAPAPEEVPTSWGLRVPRTLSAGGLEVPAPVLVESSPFYARQVARAGELHAIGEVADFRRFRSPLVRWMARFRTRVGRA
ncbi:MAG TPA: carotenoid 1,2-hydratase, partial [Myxococcaceae bacterium]|nr:carotenoid 1,2-hydratase [Myxococcaceae bacterium]